MDKHCDLVLVGDSLGSVLYNYKSTKEVSLDTMINHSKSVRLGVKKTLMVVDMPYNTYRNNKEALRNAKLVINYGTTDKTILQITLHQTSNGFNANGVYQTVVFLGAGDSLIGDSDDDQVMLNVVTRQIADIN